MRKLILIGTSLFLFGLMFSSCVKDVERPKEPLNLDPNHISVEQAISTMNVAIAELYGESATRAPRSYTIETLKGSDLQQSATRSDTLPPLPEDVLYIVNFANDEGYAILAADNRLDPVITVTEKGRLSLDDFDFRDPTDTLSPLTPNEVIGDMVKRYTFKKFDPSMNNYAIGPDGEPIDPGTIPTIIDPADPSILEKVNPLLGTMKWDQCLPFNGMAIAHGSGTDEDGYYGDNAAAGCIAVAVGQIMAYHGVPALKGINNIDLSAYGIEGPISEYKDILNTERVANPELGDANILCDTITLSDLELNRIELMVSDMPDDEKGDSLLHDYIARTVGIQPSYYVTKKITWKDIRNYNYDDADYFFFGGTVKIGGEFVPNRYHELMRKNIAYFMRWIGWGVEMKYNYGGTRSSFAYPTKARDLFRKRGYSSADRPSWDVENRNVVVDQLRAGNPVMMSALSLNSLSGHAWVIDGYYKKSRSYYLHCNWGWGGEGDGYYLSGVFDTRERESIEPGIDNEEETTGTQYDFDFVSRSVTAVPK